MSGAIGLLETRGANPLVKATDAMCKAASVELVGMIEIGGGYVTILIQGDVGSVKASVDAGAEAAAESGEVIAAHIIPQPHEELLPAFE